MESGPVFQPPAEFTRISLILNNTGWYNTMVAIITFLHYNHHMQQNVKTKAFFAVVEGKVQGVGFRYSAYNEARRLRLSGWVRNTAMGTVEVFAQGPADRADAFLQWLHRGPAGARVDRVDYSVRQPDIAYTVFSIEH